MKAERAARLFVLGLLIGIPLAVLLARWVAPVLGAGRWVTIHARMPETGGWAPADLSIPAGAPLHLKLVSDDVVHSFAIGQSDKPAIDLYPGEAVETTLVFDQPGKYTFYCTRWCGASHWRMRGTIEVTGESGQPDSEEPPLYTRLGIDIDAPHPAGLVPVRRPSARRAANLGTEVPESYLSLDYLRRNSPADAWRDLRGEKFSEDLSDEQVWDLVALIWQLNTNPQALEAGRELYAQNCAACHGETGAGDGVIAPSLSAESHAESEFSHDIQEPADFTDAESLLGASPALLQGKIVRGGMGTGMPYWGPVLTEEQTWALVDYLWSFQFDYGFEDSDE
jgi:mono/diheme cytochrome c family protein